MANLPQTKKLSVFDNVYKNILLSTGRYFKDT